MDKAIIQLLSQILIATYMTALGSCLTTAFLCQLVCDYKKVNKDKLK